MQYGVATLIGSVAASGSLGGGDSAGWSYIFNLETKANDFVQFTWEKSYKMRHGCLRCGKLFAYVSDCHQ
jgi:hypothetical protein